MHTRILILGGGSAGLYAALELEKTLARRPDIEVTLVNRDNFFLFTPMLHEVAASDLDLTHIVNPIRKLLRHVRFFEGDVESIDVDARQAVVILPELGERLGAYAQEKLAERGRLQVNEYLEVPHWPGVSASGDCAVVPDRRTGQPYPPTAQHALREGKMLARNIGAELNGGPKRAFSFTTLGQLAVQFMTFRAPVVSQSEEEEKREYPAQHSRPTARRVCELRPTAGRGQ